MRFKSNLFTNSSKEKISCSVPSFQPNKAKKLITASGKNPASLYPNETLSSVFHCKGNTGNPNLSPSRLLNFPLPTG